jgi:uncharacterized protein YjbI with pentapeptide repeats
MEGADFCNADLSGADLSNTNFEEAHLNEANLEGAKLKSDNSDINFLGTFVLDTSKDYNKPKNFPKMKIIDKEEWVDLSNNKTKIKRG